MGFPSSSGRNFNYISLEVLWQSRCILWLAFLENEIGHSTQRKSRKTWNAPDATSCGLWSKYFYNSWVILLGGDKNVNHQTFQIGTGNGESSIEPFQFHPHRWAVKAELMNCVNKTNNGSSNKWKTLVMVFDKNITNMKNFDQSLFFGLFECNAFWNFKIVNVMQSDVI